jgi:hypothetical protein
MKAAADDKQGFKQLSCLLLHTSLLTEASCASTCWVHMNALQLS